MTDARSFWRVLLKSVLIITTVSSGASVAAPDLKTDEPDRLSSDSAAAQVRAVSRRAVATPPLTTRRTGEPGLPNRQILEGASILSVDEFAPHGDSEVRIPRNSFGAGSFAISALGMRCRSKSNFSDKEPTSSVAQRQCSSVFVIRPTRRLWESEAALGPLSARLQTPRLPRCSAD